MDSALAITGPQQAERVHMAGNVLFSVSETSIDNRLATKVLNITVHRCK